MDLNRYYRAKIVGRMQAVEARRRLFLAGKLKGQDLDQEDWNLVLQMDEWAQES